MKTNVAKTYSHQELCLLIQQNAKDGFDCLYDQYCSIFYGLALKAVRSEEYARDITEITFINIWIAIPRFNHKHLTLNCWLMNILIAAAKNYLDSKNIKYVIIAENFPGFGFEIKEEKVC
ncbi:RNA polymerase sigma factor [Chryseobacterium chendengshani]|uniref:RNA polymerase sigma factor n=1 Tax=Chryseobacterium sp. LJ756 TaxID=2864113 RepID=UPI001C644753|nr:sigma factor [Chryseobacterium sp. LJ756]MBW7674918.1 hypothetical protein [Chryseobacterium sp. LJ756]